LRGARSGESPRPARSPSSRRRQTPLSSRWGAMEISGSPSDSGTMSTGSHRAA
jgi:hypothetical protein